ncbi:PKD domain-containing protein [Desulfonema magnum]|uniref:Immunoglobulin-like fold-containing n=1 Tax=Desulfonema magnum TaxID=45655 RepID=A0A975BSW3_9BACT|nr:PKD domain-containing protein [Desulfonema magnum]QTA91028.1 immunoglobulin-like fold-containing [Desulfonema magnum]
MLKKCSVAAVILFLFFLSLIAWAQIPIPARIGGTLTTDNMKITSQNDTGYTFLVTREDGTDFISADENLPRAEDTDGLNSSDWYLIDIPVYNQHEQPDGAVPGDTGVIHVYRDDTELTVISPPDGQFIIEDSGSNTRIDIIAVAETHQNRPPVADAGTGQTVSEGDTVILDGSGSSDPDPGDLLIYQWEQTTGPPVMLSDDSDARPEFTAPDAGESLTFELTVTDNDGLSDTDTVTVNVTSDENQPPVADAGPNQTVTEGDFVILDGSNSTDSDGQIDTYSWRQTRGPMMMLSDTTEAQLTFTVSDGDPEGESLIFELTVTDDEGLTDTDSVTVNITSENQPPVADAGPDQMVAEGDFVILDGSNSTDSDGQIVAYSWRQIGGSSMSLSDATKAQPTFTALDGNLAGQALTFELTVTDNSGLTSTDQVTVNITSENRPPVADAGPDQTASEEELVTLDGSNSSDADGRIASYLWRQISGTPVMLSDITTVRPAFIVSDSDIIGEEALTFELIVTDNGGLQNTDRVTVNITSENQPPVADAGQDQTVSKGDFVTLDGSDSEDTDGEIVSYSWRQTGGTVVNLSDTADPKPTFTAMTAILKSESLTFELVVTDDGGLQHTDSVTVNIIYTNQPPVADAGQDQTVSEGDIVILDGSGSGDPDDGIASYLWRQTGGTGVKLSDAAAVQPMFVAPDVGQSGRSFTFELVVTDYDGLRHSDRVTVNIIHINQPPVADAGPNQMVKEADMVMLDGSDSSDPDDGIASYLWYQTEGTRVTLSDSTAVQPVFTAPDIGLTGESLIFRLTVTDYNGSERTDYVTVNVTHLNRPPVADAGPDQKINEGCEATLNGSASADPDDGIASYFWRQTEGTSVTLSDASAIRPSFIAPSDILPASKTLTFELTVTDHGGLKDSDHVTLNVTFINRTPAADAGPVQKVNGGDIVTLDGSHSTDPDGRIVSYLWTQTDGTEVSLSNATAMQPTFAAPGVGPKSEALTFKLTVTDDGGLKDTDRVTVNIISVNQPPVADAGPDDSANEGESVILDGSDSSDADGNIVSYLWEQMNGTRVAFSDNTDVQPAFTAPDVSVNGESLIFKLTVTDDGGLKDTDRVTVNIIAANQPPVANAGYPQTAEEGSMVILDGSGSRDPYGRITSYLWKQISGTEVKLSDATAMRPTFAAPLVDSNGITLAFELTVTDNDGLQDTDEVRVTINDIITPLSESDEAGSTSGCFIRTAGEGL